MIVKMLNSPAVIALLKSGLAKGSAEQTNGNTRQSNAAEQRMITCR